MTLARRAPNSITSKKALRAELERIRGENGFAVNNQELVVDLHSIAMPVRSEKGVIAAVNIAAHTSMISLESMVDMLAPVLVETAEAISASLIKQPEGQLSNGSSVGRDG